MSFKKVDLSRYQFDGAQASSIGDLTQLDAADKQRLLYAGIDVN